MVSRIVLFRCSNITCWISTRQLTTSVTSGLDSPLRKREWRFHKNEHLRKNRQDPNLEKRARNGQLYIPLDKVHSEWKQHYGKYHLKNIGFHSHIYQDVFGFLYNPQGFMNIRYGPDKNSPTVEQGNIVAAQQTSDEPEVSLPAGLSRDTGYVTLVLSDPDGHLSDGTMELLHWMIVNIPSDKTVAEGTLISPYLQPVPPRGSGFHRYVFSLYTHAHPLVNATPTGLGLMEDGNWLNQRTFSTRNFLASHSQLTPYTFSFFQSQWDSSVHSAYMRCLAYPEPVYRLKRELTPRQARQKQIKKRRASKYKVM